MTRLASPSPRRRSFPSVSVLALGLALGATAACGDDDEVDDSGDSPGVDAGDPAPDAGPVNCDHSTLGPADRARFVLVSHPHQRECGGPSALWEVLSLSTTGDLTSTGKTFEFGRANAGEVVFTGDGKLAVARLDDGSIGIVELAADGTPRVVVSGWNGDGAFYAEKVVMSPDSSRVYVLNSQWRENGGGIYPVALACDGTPTLEPVIVAKTPDILTFTAGGQALLVAHDVYDSPAGDDVHLLQGDLSAWIAGDDVFASTDPSMETLGVQSASLTADGKYLVMGDTALGGSFSLGVAGVTDTAVTAVQSGLVPTEVAEFDPYSVIASPNNDAVLVADGFGNAFYEFSYDPTNLEAPFAYVGELAYAAGKPQLPGAAVMVTRGALRGHVLVTVVSGVRQLTFGDGGITDLGGLYDGDDNGDTCDDAVGGIGIQP